MKSCSRCGNMLADDATYCNVCNAPQTEGFDEFEPKPQYSDTFLKVLCILTIVGSVISMISSAVSLVGGAALPIEGMETLTYLGFGIAIGKLAGAIFMLNKKLTGLYIYSVAAVLTIVLQGYTYSLTSDYMASVMPGGDTIAVFSTVIGVLFLIAFLIMYWVPYNKRLLS